MSSENKKMTSDERPQNNNQSEQQQRQQNQYNTLDLIFGRERADYFRGIARQVAAVDERLEQ